jgi:hypothetical protein
MAKRWITRKQDFGESERIEVFLNAIEQECRRHGLSIAHEDSHGAFEIVEFNEPDLEWLRGAKDSSTKSDG